MVTNLMNYFWGRLSDVSDKIRLGGVLTACNNKILAAKFGNGGAPSIALRRTTNDPEEYFEALVLYDYVRYSSLPQVTKLYCGSSGLWPQQSD